MEAPKFDAPCCPDPKCGLVITHPTLDRCTNCGSDLKNPKPTSTEDNNGQLPPSKPLHTSSDSYGIFSSSDPKRKRESDEDNIGQLPSSKRPRLNSVPLGVSSNSDRKRKREPEEDDPSTSPQQKTRTAPHLRGDQQQEVEETSLGPRNSSEPDQPEQPDHSESVDNEKRAGKKKPVDKATAEAKAEEEKIYQKNLQKPYYKEGEANPHWSARQVGPIGEYEKILQDAFQEARNRNDKKPSRYLNLNSMPAAFSASAEYADDQRHKTLVVGSRNCPYDFDKKYIPMKWSAPMPYIPETEDTGSASSYAMPDVVGFEGVGSPGAEIAPKATTTEDTAGAGDAAILRELDPTYAQNLGREPALEFPTAAATAATDIATADTAKVNAIATGATGGATYDTTAIPPYFGDENIPWDPVDQNDFDFSQFFDFKSDYEPPEDERHSYEGF